MSPKQVHLRSPKRFELQVWESGILSGVPIFSIELPRVVLGTREPSGLVGNVQFFSTFPPKRQNFNTETPIWKNHKNLYLPISLHTLQLRLQRLRSAEITLLQRPLIGPETRIGGRQQMRIRSQFVQFNGESRKAVEQFVIGRQCTGSPNASRGRSYAAIQRFRPLAEQLSDGLAWFVVHGTDDLKRPT